jgi:hypothetical protein
MKNITMRRALLGMLIGGIIGYIGAEMYIGVLWHSKSTDPYIWNWAGVPLKCLAGGGIVGFIAGLFDPWIRTKP